METAEILKLTDESVYPDQKVIRDALGNSYPGYEALLELFAAHGLSHEWRYYRDGKAWLCKVTLKKKTIVWVSMWDDHVKATIYVPEKYAERLEALALSAETKARLEGAGNAGKSRACTFVIRSGEDITDFSLVMTLKTELK